MNPERQVRIDSVEAAKRFILDPGDANVIIGSQWCTDAAIKILVESPAMKKIESLRISAENGISDESALAIARSPWVVNLHTLMLQVLGYGAGGLTDAGIQALAESQFLANLESILVNEEWVSEKGFRTLANSQQLKNFRSLQLEKYWATSNVPDTLRITGCHGREVTLDYYSGTNF